MAFVSVHERKSILDWATHYYIISNILCMHACMSMWWWWRPLNYNFCWQNNGNANARATAIENEWEWARMKEKKKEKNNVRYIISSTTIENKIKKAKIVSYSILSHTESGICNDLFHANEKKTAPNRTRLK